MHTMVPSTAARSKGTLNLAPIEGSADQKTYVVEVTLDHEPGVLTLGDLRRAAEKLSVSGEYEQAFRVWSYVETAAERVGNEALKQVATSRAGAAAASAHGSDSKVRTPSPATRLERREPESFDPAAGVLEVPGRGPKYDYDRLAADRAEGMSLSAVAKKWGCSPSTVHRAEEYVAQRDDVVDMYPELLDQLMAGVDLQELSDRYDVSTKVLKWMVSTRFERRRS